MDEAPIEPCQWGFVSDELRVTNLRFPAATLRQTLSPACGAAERSPGCSHAVAEPGVGCKNDEESGQHRDCDAVEDGRLNGDGR